VLDRAHQTNDFGDQIAMLRLDIARVQQPFLTGIQLDIELIIAVVPRSRRDERGDCSMRGDARLYQLEPFGVVRIRKRVALATARWREVVSSERCGGWRG
jgi:hypothetical protein